METKVKKEVKEEVKVKEEACPASDPPVTAPAQPKVTPKKEKASETPTSGLEQTKSTDEEMATPTRTRKRRGIQPNPEASEVKDTPKRRKTQTTFYQSPILAMNPAKSNGSTSSKSTPADKVQLFKKGKFLAVRNADAGFFLCQASQNVFKGCKPFKIRWLTNEGSPSDTFKLDFYDTVELETVLTSVNMTYINKESYKLPKKEKEKAEMILKKALNAEKGINIEPEDDDDDVDDEEEEEEAADDVDEDTEDEVACSSRKSKRSSPRSKARTTPSPRKTATATVNKGNRIKLKAEKPKKRAPPPQPASKGKAKAKASPKLKTPSPSVRKHQNDRLKVNTAVKKLEKDPFFESRETVPALNCVIASKLLFRALQLNDMKLLQRYVDDNKHIAKLDLAKNIWENETVLNLAIKSENLKAFEILYGAIFKKEPAERVKPPQNMLSTIGTGSYNMRSLGIPSIRKLTMSRGSKEGNNALIKDECHITESQTVQDIYWSAINTGVKPSFFVRMMKNGIKDIDYSQVHTKIFQMVRRGHRKLAGHVLEDYMAVGNFGFGVLHKNVLLFDKEDLPNVKAVSVKKKPYDNAGITPLHCAAINPNVKYLTKLLTLLPEYNIMDKNHWRPIHYAAACEGPGPLELFLSRGVSPDETETEGMTPLIIACKTGRAKNVEVLLKKAKTDSEASKGDNPMFNKWGIGGINRSTRFGECGIHLAAKNGYMDVLKVLLKYGVDVNRAQSAGKHKATALMEASGFGNLEMVRLLVQSKANIEAKDRMKRTALMYAVMNGQTHVASYFLHLGANPNHADSSGNTCLHYAVAYGWYYCMQILIQAGADASIVNSWKVSVVNIAFLKGHIGLMDDLLEEPNVDINFKDDSGMNLVMMAVDCVPSAALFEQLEHIVNDHSGDCSVTDVEGNNCLHHIAQNTPKDKDQEEYSKKMVELLLSKECDINQLNKRGQTPIMVAMAVANIEMVKFFVELGGIISTECDQNGNNAMHTMAKNCIEYDMASLLPVLAKSSATKSDDGWGPVKAMAKVVNHEGFTPLLLASFSYSQFRGGHGNQDVRGKYWEKGRNFIKALIEKAESSITATVEKVKESQRKNDDSLSDEEDAAEDDEDEDDDDNGVEQEGPSIEEDAVAAAKQGEAPNHDPYGPNGKCSMVHFLSQVKWEFSVKKENEEEVTHAALRMILEYKPPLDLADKEGRTPLIRAINDDEKDVANILIDAGADVNIASENDKLDGKSSPLVLAVRKKQCGVVEKLVKKGANVNAIDHRNQNTALHYAAINKVGCPLHPLQVLHNLLDAKAIVNCVNNRKRTPLHLAVNANSGSTDETTEVEELLLEKGADKFARDVRGRVPLHYAFVKMGRHKDTSALDPIELCSTLTEAMGGVDVDFADVFGQSPLHLAARRGATVCFMHLAKNKNVKIDREDLLGNTPLSLAVLAGHDSCAISLIQKGANINVNCVIAPDDEKAKDKKEEKPVWKWKPLKAMTPPENQKYPLFLGVIQKDWQGVTYIILDLLDNFGVPYTQCVECALNEEKFQLALRLINRMKDHSRLAILNNEKQNLFHVLCQSQGDNNMQLKVAEALLSKGIPLNDRDISGCTPLHYAALTINKPLAKFILEKTSDAVATVDSFGRTALAALFWDLEHNMSVDEDFCQLLLDKGGKIDTLCDYPAFHPAYYGSKVPASSTRYHTKLDTDRIAPLAYAVGLKNFDLAKMLLKLGATVNVRDSKKRTPIMYAVRQNDIHMLKLLLDHSYDKDAVKTDGDKKKPKLVKKKSVVQKRIFQLKKMDSFKQNLDEDEKETKEEVAEKVVGNNRRKSTQLDDDIVMNFEPFPKKSDVDLTVEDDQAWTVVHHLASPLEVGSYDNLEMLKILVDNGAPLTAKDRAGLTALDCALNNGATKLSKGIQKLLEKEKEKWEKPTYQSIEINDSISWSTPQPDFSDDCKAFLSHLEETSMDTSDGKPSLEPDHRVQAHVDSQGEIVMDEDLNIPYNVLLNKVDVAVSAWGMYNFYIMQLIRHQTKDLFILFTRWGRLGDEGQYQQTPFSTLEEALKEFRKVFKEKTANEWSNIKSFEKQPKKYRLVQHEDKRTKPPEVKFHLKSQKSSLLPPETQHMIKEFTNVQSLETSMKGLGVDYEFMPLGRIKKDALLEARLLLGKLSECIEKKDKHQNGEEKLELADYQKLCEEIVQLSNEYYQLVPQHGYVNESIRPIEMDYQIKEHKRLVDNLLDLEVASKVVCAAQHRVNEINPLDYVYRTIDCKIQLMNEDDPMTQYILQYVYNTGGDSAMVEAIFKVSRAGEEERFQKCDLSNRKLLFHGTCTANMISILKRGLLIAPPEAPRCGAMFGDGIYLADSFSKSRNYCYNRYTHTGSTETSFMFVCEVALGNVKAYYEAEDGPIEKKYNSTVGIGGQGPDPRYDICLPTGAVIPLGNTIPTPKPDRDEEGSNFYFSLNQNEYIVYDEGQTCLRYIIQFR